MQKEKILKIKKKRLEIYNSQITYSNENSFIKNENINKQNIKMRNRIFRQIFITKKKQCEIINY